MERYHDFQIKDHYFWSGEAPEYVTKEERAAKAKSAPKPQPAKPSRERSIQVVEADGTISSHAAYQHSKPFVMPGGIWV